MRLSTYLIVLLCSSISLSIAAQCPELQSEESNPNCSGICDVCIGDDITFSLIGDNMNDGDCIDWYIDLNGSVSPGSTFIGCSAVSTDCAGGPVAMYAMISPQASGGDRCDEYVVIYTGSTGFNIDDLVVQNAMGGAGLAPYVMGNSSVITGGGCETYITAGDAVPANAIIILQTAATGTTTYDITTLCALGIPVFVVASANTSCGGGFFINGGGPWSYEVELSGCVSDVFTYSGPSPTGYGWSYQDGTSVYGNTLPTLDEPGFNPGAVTIDDFTFTIDQSIIDNFCTPPTVQLDIQGYLNPQAGGACSDVETAIYNLSLSCPEANPAGPLETCTFNGLTIWNLTDLNNTISGGFGAVTWYSNAAGTNVISNPFGYMGGSPVFAAVELNGCVSELVQIDLVAFPEPDATPVIDTPVSCAGIDVNFSEIGGDAVMWDWEAPDGMMYSGQFITVPNAPVGNYTVSITDGNGCTNTGMVAYNPPAGPEIEWTIFNEEVCTGECVEMSFMITGGTAPYTLQIEGTTTIPPIPFPIGELCEYQIDAGQTFVSLCLDEPGVLVNCDAPNDEFGVPVLAAIAGSGEFELISLVDANGCIGTVNPSLLIISLGAPFDPVDPGPLEVCGQTGVDTDFDIASLEGTIGGGNPIEWYENSTATIPIVSSPYTVNMNTTIYAVVDNGECISDPIPIQLNIVDTPSAGDNGMLTVCADSGMSQDLFAALGGSPAGGGTWSDDDNSMAVISGNTANFDNVVPGMYTFTYTVSGGAGCGDATAEVEVDVNSTPMFDNVSEMCIDNNANYLISFTTEVGVSVDVDPQASLIGVNGGMIEVTLPANPGTITITITNGDGCQNALSINFTGCDCPMIDPPVISNVTYCAGETIPVVSGGVPNDQSINWYDSNGVLIFSGDVFTPTAPGTYFAEAFDPADGCTSDQVSFELIELPILSAGMDNAVFVCIGSDFDLLTALNGNDFVGEFSDTTASMALSGTVVITSLLEVGGSYLFTHMGVGNMDCEDSDGADIVVNIVGNVSAGSNVMDTLCEPTALDLFTILAADADAGGTFSDPNSTGFLTGGIFAPGNSGIFNLTYTVGGGACPVDQSMYTIDVRDVPMASIMTNEINLCNGECGMFTISYLAENSDAYFIIEDENGTILMDTIVLGPTNTTVSQNLPVCNEFGGFLDLQNLPSGHAYTITLASLNTLGCEYDINSSIEVSTFGTDTMFFQQNLCIGTNITIGGQIFDVNNPSDTIDLMNSFGCDSTLAVDLKFSSQSEGFVDGTFCSDYSVVVNGTTYDINMDSGMELLPNGSVAGCDSLIIIDLQFFPPATGNFNGPLCESESIMIGTETFDINTPIGTVVLPGASINGCDSTVMVNIQFEGDAINNVNPTICPDESIVIEGMTFDIFMPVGNILLQNQSALGCDSIIDVALNFFPPATDLLNGMFCADHQEIINGNIYDVNTPSGVEILNDASINGCNVELTIDLDFFPPAIGIANDMLCAEETMIINGTTYDIDMPTGQEIIPNASAAGCDSTVNVDLSFFPEALGFINETLCEGQTIVVNGMPYDIQNPMGTEIIPSASANGCDSIVMVDLEFDQQISSDYMDTLCMGESISLGGTLFDENNPSGTALIPSFDGMDCDTLLMVSLEFGRIYDFTVVEPCSDTDDVEVIFEGANVVNFPFTIDNGLQTFGPFNQLPISFNLPAGTNNFSVTDGTACIQQESVSIPSASSAQLEAVILSVVGEAYQVSYNTNVDPTTIEWSPASAVDCVNCPITIANGDQDQEITVTLTYGNGCMITDALQLTEIASTDVFIPSTFSPNNDGINDKFFIQTESDYDIKQFLIYDRWGNLVLERKNVLTNDPESGWGGDWNDENVVPGVYVYFIVVDIPGIGERNYGGDVTIVR